MSFIKKIWKNRESENPIRRRLTRVDTGVETVYDVERDEGLVTEAGDDFSAENMNDLEQRIKNAFDDAGGGNFVGVRYHASLVQFPDYPCWEDLTAAQKAKFDFSTGATVNFLDEDDSDNIIGTTDISDIADGTLTGAVDEHDTEITQLKSFLSDINVDAETEHGLVGALKWKKTNSHLKFYLKVESGTSLSVTLNSGWTSLNTSNPLSAPLTPMFFIYSQLTTGKTFHGKFDIDGIIKLYSNTSYTGEVYFDPQEYTV